MVHADMQLGHLHGTMTGLQVKYVTEMATPTTKGQLGDTAVIWSLVPPNW